MSTMRLVGISAIVVLTMGASLGRAGDISTKKLLIKDNKTDSTKRMIQVQSADAAIQVSDAVSPDLNGASIHVYSATDDFCAILPSGSDWKSKPTKWQFNDKTSKDVAQLKAGKLLVKIKTGVTFSLMDNHTQGHVNVQVQLGTGTKFCMQCPGNKKDEDLKFLAKDCAATTCDPEPSTCSAASTTTTTTTIAGGSTTSTTIASGGTVLKGALLSTPGRFNFNAVLGLPGANAACNTHFSGTHACNVTDLANAQAAGDLVGLQDVGANMVTAFWAIDSTAAALSQCEDDAVGGSGLNWEYGTAHTPSRGNKLPLNNGTGTLGSLQTGLQCNFSGNAWVGCCL
jgi:hypothetical protein